MLQHGKFMEYAHYQCLKICDYIKMTRGVEILSMRAEFLKDDLENVWFSYANNIYFRKGKGKMGVVDDDAEQAQET